MERRQQPARINNRPRPDPIMVDVDLELPAPQNQRLTLVDTARDPAVRLDPVNGKEAESMQGIEVDPQLVRHRPR